MIAKIVGQYLRSATEMVEVAALKSEETGVYVLVNEDFRVDEGQEIGHFGCAA